MKIYAIFSTKKMDTFIGFGNREFSSRAEERRFKETRHPCGSVPEGCENLATYRLQFGPDNRYELFLCEKDTSAIDRKDPWEQSASGWPEYKGGR